MAKSRAEIESDYRARNPEKIKAAQKRWREKNPDKVRERNKVFNRKRSKEDHAKYMREWRIKRPHLAKNADLKKSYGLTLEEYNGMLEKQGMSCYICKSPKGERMLSVDHCHKTGVIRGVLCHRCNTAIGLLKEDVNIVMAVAEYLNMWSGND